MYDEHPNAGRQTTQELVGIHNDSASKTTGKTAEETIEKMEEDAQLVLKFMASNGLVANAKKTSFLLLNYKQKDSELSIKIGNDVVPRECSFTLLLFTLRSAFTYFNQHAIYLFLTNWQFCRPLLLSFTKVVPT